MSKKKLQSYKIKSKINADMCTKEQFELLFKNGVSTPILLYILDDYSVEVAQQQNESFAAFFNKLSKLV